MRCEARRKKISLPERPTANTTAGNHARIDQNRPASPSSGSLIRVNTNHAIKNIIARDSSGGISKVRIANAGQVAHSRMDKAPMRVQVFRESGYSLAEGGLSVPNDNGALDMLDA